MQINENQFKMLSMAKQRTRGSIKPIYQQIRVTEAPDRTRKLYGFNLLGFLLECSSLGDFQGVFVPLGYANLLRDKYDLDGYIQAKVANQMTDIEFPSRQKTKTIEGRVHYPVYMDNLKYNDSNLPLGDYFLRPDTTHLYWETMGKRGLHASFISNEIFFIK